MRALTIVKRDLKASWKGLAVGAAIIVLVWFFVTNAVGSPPAQGPADPYATIRTPMFGIALLPSVIALGVSASRLYGGDIMEGRTQSMFHYSMSYNEVHTVKAVSSLIPGSLISLLICLTFVQSLAQVAGLPAGEALGFALAVFGAIMFAAGTVALWAIGLSTLVSSAMEKLTFAFHRVFALSLALSLFATETVLESVGLSILAIFGVIRGPQDVADWAELVDAVVALSPIHVAGRLLANATGANVGLDLHIVAPAAVAALVVGTIVGARQYPDLFLQQVTS